MSPATSVSPHELDQQCVNTLRFLSVDMVQKANSGHPGLPMGAAAMAFALWDRFLKFNPHDPLWVDRDRFILSAGHGSALLYSLLHVTGFDLPLEELKRFRQWGSRTPGHPEYGKTPGVEATTGPLGQGLANAVGMAIAEVAYKLNGEKGSTGLRGVYKVGAFYHSADFDDFENASRQHTGDFGAYFIVDQQLWRKPGSEDQGLSGFLRIGGTPADRNTVPFYCDCGFNYKGLFQGRDQDIVGIGFSYTSLSSSKASDSDGSFTSHHETILEATYKVVIKDWLSIQPDFQYIFTPGGDRNAQNAVVAGIRFNLTYQ